MWQNLKINAQSDEKLLRLQKDEKFCSLVGRIISKHSVIYPEPRKIGLICFIVMRLNALHSL